MFIDSFQQFLRAEVQPGEGKPFLAQVLQRGSDVVDIGIDDKEAVVRLSVFLDSNGWIFGVVALDVELQGLVDAGGEYGSTSGFRLLNSIRVLSST